MGDQDLSFKVMRLCRPGFHQTHAAYTEEGDVLGCLGGIGSDCELSDSDTGAASGGFGLTGMLTLPPNFGKTYMGEKFSSYISAFNHSRGDVTNVGLKAELQTKTTRKTLLDTTATPLLGFPAADNRDFVVEAPLRELGTHILVCSAQYVNAFGEKKAFRQFFKFQVLEAFDVKKEIRALPCGANGCALFLEVILRSKMSTPIFLEKVQFQEAPIFTRTEWELAADGPVPATPKASFNCFICPSDTRQFLYRLEPREALSATQGYGLGQFEMVWRSAVGERGEIQQPVEFRPPPRHNKVDADASAEEQKIDGALHSGSSNGLSKVVVASSSSTALLACGVTLTLESLPADGIIAQALFAVGLIVSNWDSAPKDLTLVQCSTPGQRNADAVSASMEDAHADQSEQHAAGPTSNNRQRPHARRSRQSTELENAEAAIWEALSQQDVTDVALDSRGPVWMGASPLVVGRVDGNSQKRVTATFFVSCVGEHALPTLALVDQISGQRYEFGNCGRFLVR